MALEIELDSFNHLDNGDCLELCGVIGTDIFDIIMSSDNKPKFKFSIDQRFGWDVYTWSSTTCDIDSGSNHSFLAYDQNCQFTLCFHFKSDQISTLLNDSLLSTTQILSPIEKIDSVKISGDNSLKYISFSDCSKKSSRILQPAIHKSMESNLNDESDLVSIIESRKRIVFKSKSSDNENDLFSESENESEDEVFATKSIDCDFKYLNSILLGRSMSNDEEIVYQYPNDIPENKYVINYFNPVDSISDSEDVLMKSFKEKVESQLLEMENLNIQKNSGTFNDLKSQLKNIWQNLENTGYDIEKIKSTPTLSSPELEPVTRIYQTFQIPILKKNAPPVKLKIPNHRSDCVNKKSKIPVLLTKQSSIENRHPKKNEQRDLITDISKKRKYKLTKKIIK